MPPVDEYVCRKCRESVKKNATRCRHCGYSKRSHGGIFSTIALLLSWTPFGWLLMADNVKSKSIAVKK